MIPWELVILLVGIAYGYFTPGRQDKMTLFRNGVIIGVVVAVVFALIGYLAGIGGLGLGVGILGLIISVIILTVVFVIGAWIGDFLEGAPKKA